MSTYHAHPLIRYRIEANRATTHTIPHKLLAAKLLLDRGQYTFG